MTRPGLQNQAQKAPKIEAKSRFKKASERVSKKGFGFGSHFKALFDDFGGPRGGWRSVNGFQNRFKNGLGFNLQEPILTPSGLDFGASGFALPAA